MNAYKKIIKNMNGLYLTVYDTNDTSSGVCKKIKSQVKVFEENGINIDIIDPNSISVIKNSYMVDAFYAILGKNNINLYRMFDVIKQKMLEKKYNFIYIRYPLMDKFQVDFFKSIKKTYPSLKLFFEIPTYPYDSEIRLSQRLVSLNDKKFRKQLKDFADRIITYSKDKKIFGVKTINISNGIDYTRFKLRTPIQHSGINVVAVALFEKWHGYDRFLNGMFQQPEIVRANNIHLYLAGKGRVLSKYKSETMKHKLSKYVHFMGEIHGEELNLLYNQADIALDSMGRHRVGVYFNSSLKGKEYCAYGVPIISGVTTELDSLKDFKYYLRVPADESVINMNDVVSFFYKCYNEKTSIEVAEEIRNFTIPFFELGKAFKPVVDYIKD